MPSNSVSEDRGMAPLSSSGFLSAAVVMLQVLCGCSGADVAQINLALSKPVLDTDVSETVSSEPLTPKAVSATIMAKPELGQVSDVVTPADGTGTNTTSSVFDPPKGPVGTNMSSSVFDTFKGPVGTNMSSSVFDTFKGPVGTNMTSSVFDTSKGPVGTNMASSVFDPPKGPVGTNMSSSVFDTPKGPVGTNMTNSVLDTSKGPAGTNMASSVFDTPKGPVGTNMSSSVFDTPKGPVGTNMTSSVLDTPKGPVGTNMSSSVFDTPKGPVGTNMSSSVFDTLKGPAIANMTNAGGPQVSVAPSSARLFSQLPADLVLTGQTQDRNNTPDPASFIPGLSARQYGGLATQGGVDADTSSPTADHTPLACSGSEVSLDSVDTICDGSQRAWSCEGKCSQAFKTPCSCHASCVLHNTCCLDFEQRCPDLARAGREQLSRFPGLAATCDPSVLSPLVSRCPDGASEPARGLCERASQNASSLLDLAPVSDSVYLWSFRNKHCWRCWNTGHQALRWRLNVSMSFRNRMLEDYRLDSLMSFMADNQESVLWYPPAHIVKPQCSPAVVSLCSACGHTNATVAACAGGPHAYVLTASGVYRNMYCLLCSKHRQQGARAPCYQKEVETLTMHGLNFPVTMILPDADDAADVKLIQDKLVYGGFLWNEISCSVSRGTCEARRCSHHTLVYNGRCDEGVTPITLKLQICAAHMLRGDMVCVPSQPALLSSRQEVLEYVTSYAEELLEKYSATNRTLMESAITESKESGLELLTRWFVPYRYDVQPVMVRHSRVELMNIVDRKLQTSGWLMVCLKWSSSTVPRAGLTYDPALCYVSLPCPPPEQALQQHGNHAPAPRTRCAVWLWLAASLIMAASSS
ncbi:hypothetical protein EGW08_002508 [Elysia chlorotica]|uniref:SMB domain-containing protein n=1 Tax=Elysia chlorotica TaxID=188477 RepID=A0A3S1BRJ3_ELYCH|nr:hypothetical protein EGW08_002508 [Elysia chlorotica]